MSKIPDELPDGRFWRNFFADENFLRYSTLPRIYKVEMQHVSLLYYSAKPQSRAFWVVPYVIVRQNHSILAFCQSLLSVRSVLTVPCIVTLLSYCRCSERWSWSRQLLTVAARLWGVRYSACHSSICLIFFDISKCSHRFRLQAQKDHWCERPFLAKNNLLALLMIQSRQDTHQQNWNYALKQKIDTQK